MRRDLCAVWFVVIAGGLFPSPVRADVQFNRDIRPILSEHCFSCHGPDSASRKADLRLDERDPAIKGKALVPGYPDRSELVRRILSVDPDEVMPPPETKRTLTATQKQLLQDWIREGATYERHWAFIPVPKSVPVPEVNGAGRIDAFVREALQKKGISTAPPAARETWLRRVTLDLTGLPPTLDEIDAFLSDTSDTAFETVVDRLLASSSYGERMANDWMDVARYAETFGYQADRNMHMWPWRDWVIRSFNENLPYNDFIQWQLAGDLLPSSTRDQRLATAFNRLHRQTNEGGSVEEEFRIEYVADRVRTVGTAMLGLTLECARCHDHKYDPVSQREYYSLTAFFNNIDEHGLYSHFTETAPTPVLWLSTDEQDKQLRALQEQISVKEKQLRDVLTAITNPTDKPQATDVAAEIIVPVPLKVFDFEQTVASGDDKPVAGVSGQAIEFGGDDALPLPEAGTFSRVTPFSFDLWIKPGPHQARQVVLHQSRAAEDSAFRGLSLVLDQGVPVFSLVHFWPGNAIQVRARSTLPVGEWARLAVTWNGSSRADGVRLYLNGEPLAVDIVRDQLTRDIVHLAAWGDSDVGNVHLTLGARFRDVGFRQGAIDQLQVFNVALTTAEVRHLHGTSASTTTSEYREHHALRSDANCLSLKSELSNLRMQENTLAGQIPQIMAMQELSGRRPTFVLDRGAYDAPKEPVSPDVPGQIMAWNPDWPANRLGFARWLLDDSQPLTSRVAVNRYWGLFFGAGLVTTAEDFGNQGAAPSHPELLDWLARDFMRSGWDVKRLCRQIVLSDTYRQSSVPVDRTLLLTDPGNRLLARGPRHRLSAEMLRDQALAVSGLLNRRIGGASVFPYQPDGLWEEAGTGKSYQQSKGPDLYRRSLYTFWRRTSPPPSMTVFDAPSREYCVIQRERTATPVQALTLLNDPQFVEAARVLAERILNVGETGQGDKSQADDARLNQMFRMVTGRHARAGELLELQKLLIVQRELFTASRQEASALVAVGEAPVPPTLDVLELAAWTAVAQVLFSFDECQSKR